MWQCSSKGSVNGINGNVDLSVDFGASDSNQNSNTEMKVEEGTYAISSALNTDKIFSVSGGSVSNGGIDRIDRTKNTRNNDLK